MIKLAVFTPAVIVAAAPPMTIMLVVDSCLVFLDVAAASSALLSAICTSTVPDARVAPSWVRRSTC